MKSKGVLSCIGVLAVCVLFVSAIYAAGGSKGKIPITTSSQKAMQLFLQGRDLSEKLRGQDSLQYLEKAVAEDPNFAMGYLFLSLGQPTAKGFFENLNKAVALAEKASEAERVWILGVQAGANALPAKQKEYYQKLTEAFPNDERAHTLLGNYYFGQQLYDQAISEFEKAISINPDFSQPYNQLGYSYRFIENYVNADKTFQKYITLIPNDPNPYDSYAELLLKMGKYDASIEYYQKALKVNPNFVNSFLGIATDLNYLGKFDDARQHLQKLYSIARNDGEKRAAHFAITLSYVHEGNIVKALEELKKQFALAEKINDAGAMAGDMIIMGNINYEAGNYDKALTHFEKSLKIIQGSNLSKEIKENANRIFLYNSGRVALKQKDFASAKAKAEQFLSQVSALNSPFQIRLAHELAGMIALEEKDFEKAITEFASGNQQNPYNLYRMALAYQGKGDSAKAKEYFKKTANFNSLNDLNLAFIRKKAIQSQ